MDLVLKNYEATVSCVETSAIFMHHFQEIAPVQADGAEGGRRSRRGWWTTWGVSVTEILEASQQPQHTPIAGEDSMQSGKAFYLNTRKLLAFFTYVYLGRYVERFKQKAGSSHN
jgi:hypothetical protein